MRKSVAMRFIAALLVMLLPLTSAPDACAEVLNILGVTPETRAIGQGDTAVAPTLRASEESDDLEPELARCFNQDRSEFTFPGTRKVLAAKPAVTSVAMIITPPVSMISAMPDGGLVTGPLALLATNAAMDVTLDGIIEILSGKEYAWKEVKSSVRWSVVITVLTLGGGALITKAEKIFKLRMLLKHPEAAARIAKLLSQCGGAAKMVMASARERGVKLASFTTAKFRQGLLAFLGLVRGRRAESPRRDGSARATPAPAGPRERRAAERGSGAATGLVLDQLDVGAGQGDALATLPVSWRGGLGGRRESVMVGVDVGARRLLAGGKPGAGRTGSGARIGRAGIGPLREVFLHAQEGSPMNSSRVTFDIVEELGQGRMDVVYALH